MSNGPATIDVRRVEIVKSSGESIDLKNTDSTVDLLEKITIEEDIFTPGLKGSLIFNESSQIGEMLPLVGGEQLLLDIGTPDVEESNKSLKFYVHGVTPNVDEVNALMRGNIKEQTWTVEFASYENIYANYTVETLFEETSNNFVGKIASGEEDDDENQGLVQYLADKFFNPNDTGNSSKEMDIEPTSNSVWLKRNHMLYPFRKQVQQMSPIQLMNYVTERAVSEDNPNATNYLFWQDFDQWHFRSVNSIIKNAGEVRNYYVDFDRNLNLPDAFSTFIVAKEYTPLEFMNSGAYLSAYDRISPDYENPYVDFTSFYDGHTIEKVTYSYQEEKDNIERIEEFPLIDDEFEFEVSDSVKKYDHLHGYFDESHYNDSKIRLRHDQSEYSVNYLPDKNHIEPNKSYNESLLWQPMFDQTNASVDTIKAITEIKEELEENRIKLAFKKDLKEKWATYKCSVCCLRGGPNDGTTGEASSSYNVVAAGSFTDTVNYEPNNPDANENGLISSYPFDNEDSYYNITMGELYNLKQPEELKSTLFQLDATIYSLERMQQSVQEQIDYCTQYPAYANTFVTISRLEREFQDETLIEWVAESNTPGLHDGAYEWSGTASPLGGSPDESTPPYTNASYHGIYQNSVGGVHHFPCTGCYTEPDLPPPTHIAGSSFGPKETSSGTITIDYLAGTEDSDQNLFSRGWTDINRPDDCVINWGPSAVLAYARKQQLIQAYKDVLVSSWEEFVNRKVFVQSKSPYLDVPEDLTTNFENVKSIKRKNIRGSRYEVFALKESLVDDVESSYDYFVSYADFAGGTSGTHPYYDQKINTEIGSYNGLINPSILLSGIVPGEVTYTTENALVYTEEHVNDTSYDKQKNGMHPFTLNQPRYFALSGVNNTTLLSIFGHPGHQGAWFHRDGFNRNEAYEAQYYYAGTQNDIFGIFQGFTGEYGQALSGVDYFVGGKVNADQPYYSYNNWSGAGQAEFNGLDFQVVHAGDLREQQRFYFGNLNAGGFSYNPFDVFFTPFMGTKNNLSGKRIDVNYGRGSFFHHASDVGHDVDFNSSNETTPFGYYDGDHNPGLYGREYGDVKGVKNLGTSSLGDNVFDADEFAKKLGMSSFGLSSNYDSHFYRDFGFPGELIIKITPTRASSFTQGEAGQPPSGGGGGSEPDIEPPEPPEPPDPIEIAGCTDPDAVNYNPVAEVDDGSCEYREEEDGGVPGGIGGGSDAALVRALQASCTEFDGPIIPEECREQYKFFNLDGQLTIELVGISINGGRGGQLGYIDDYISGGNKSPLYRDDGFLEYNVGPQYTNACDTLDCSDLLNDYVNRANWYTPRESFKSPRRFFAEVQSYVRIEFETPIGEDTLVDFPYGFIRDAGVEYYAPYIVQLTPGPFGRQSANYNMSVIGVDPYGFDVAVTRTDKWKDYLFESGTKPVLYPIKAVEAEAYDPINVFYRTVTEENQWAHISFNNLPIPGERLPSSWHSFKAPMSGISPDVIFEQHFQSLLWHNEDYSQFMTDSSYQGQSKLNLLDQRAYQRYSWGGAGFVKNAFIEDFGMMWDYNEENFPPPEDVDVFSPEEYIWKFDISGESEYGVFTPPENATTLDDVKLDDYIHDLERNFSGQFVVFSRGKRTNVCDRYECANPDGPVTAPPPPEDPAELEDYDPYIDCPMQELRPDVIEYEKYLEQLELEEQEEDLGRFVLNKFFSSSSELTEDDFKEPTATEIAELESQVDECALIEEKLGENYLGCIYSDPNASNSCNCPNQGENYTDYLEASRTYATFWDTPNEAPLRREAQMTQLTTQKAIGVLPGDLSLRPGQIINVVNGHSIDNKHPSKRSSGRWLLGSIKHEITIGKHMMGLTCFRDSTPQNPNDISEPVYTQE